MSEEKKDFSPYVISKNSSVDRFRIQKEEKDPVKKFPLGKFSFQSIINFGSRTPNCYEKCKLIGGKGVILNHPDTIPLASDKLTCKRRLINAKVPTPRFQLPGELKLTKEGVQGLTLKFPIVAKLRHGSGGEGMFVLHDVKEVIKFFADTKSDLLREYFFEEVFQEDLKKSYEFRVSVSPLLYMKRMFYDNKGFNTLSGEIVVLRKLMKQEAVEAGGFGRNIALGNSYFTRTFERAMNKNSHIMNIEDAISIAIEACNACELDFGAVDMLWDSQTGTWTVLEINTAPSMGDENSAGYTAERWRVALREMLLEKKKLQ